MIDSTGLAIKLELNDYLDESFFKKSYLTESFIRLKQRLFYED